MTDLMVYQNDTDSPGTFELVRHRSFTELMGHIVAEEERIAAGGQPIGIPPSVNLVGLTTTTATSAGPLRPDAPLSPGTYAVICTRLSASGDAAVGIFLVGPYFVDEE